jgi:hypothetical protein
MKLANTNNKWSKKNSFKSLKHELMRVDPVYFAETYLNLEGEPMRIVGNGWKFIADIYRHIVSVAASPDGRPIIIVKGRQVAATTMAAALDLYFVAGGVYGRGGKLPARVMHLFPQLEMMYAFSKDKLERMIRDSMPVNDDGVKRSRDVEKSYVESMKDAARDASDSLTFKQFKYGNSLWCDSIGNEGVRVRGRTADIIFFDEAQLMTKRAIDATTKCLTRAKYGPEPGGVQVYFGTPEQQNTYFHEMWQNSDQRRFYLGCEKCGENFLLYTPDSDMWYKEIWVRNNIVKCPSCQCEQEKIGAVERGRWITTPGKDGAPYVGFHFNQLFIPEFTKEIILAENPEFNSMKREIDWKNETLGEFHSGEGMPMTREVIYEKCRDSSRGMAEFIPSGERTVYMGIDWGGKPDIDGAKRGQSFSCAVIISVEHDGRLAIESAEKLKKLDINSKVQFVEEAFNLYSVRASVGDIGFAEDVSNELKSRLGDRYKTARNAGFVVGGAKYNSDYMEIAIDKDKWVEEIFGLMRRGGIRFPWASYERIAWLVDHCCSMQMKTTTRHGMPHTTYIKGNIQNDGLMALIYAYVAYKFDITNGFKVHPASPKAGRILRPVLAYAPKFL